MVIDLYLELNKCILNRFVFTGGVMAAEVKKIKI